MSIDLNKYVGRKISKNLIKVQVLNKSMQVGFFQKINKICCTIIRDVKVPSFMQRQITQNLL